MKQNFFSYAYLKSGQCASAGLDPFSRPCAGLFSGLAQNPTHPTTVPVLFDLLSDVLCTLPPAEQCFVVHVMLKALAPEVPEEVRQKLISSFPVTRPTTVRVEGNYYHLHDNKIYEK